MRKIFAAAAFMITALAAGAQVDTTAPARPKTVTVTTPEVRSNDHLLIQLGYTRWQGAPDSIKAGGFSRTFNAYLMMDFPFKTNPHWSVAVGVGIATDHIVFNKGAVDIAGNTPVLQFRNLADTNHFKRYKLATAYAEAPVELRFTASPDNNSRSLKVALGVKVGTMLSAHTKGNNLQNAAGNTINNYKVKEFKKDYFNKTRLSGTARIGVGHFSLFGSYQLTPLFKEGVAAEIRPYTIGLTLNGL